MCGGVCMCVCVCVCVGLRAEYRGGLSGEPAGKYSQQSSDVYERGWVAVAGFVWVVCWFVWPVVLCCGVRVVLWPAFDGVSARWCVCVPASVSC